MIVRRIACLLLPVIVLLAACESESRPLAPAIQAMSFANSKWSDPMNIGPMVNSAFGDNNARRTR